MSSPSHPIAPICTWIPLMPPRPIYKFLFSFLFPVPSPSDPSQVSYYQLHPTTTVYLLGVVHFATYHAPFSLLFYFTISYLPTHPFVGRSIHPIYDYIHHDWIHTIPSLRQRRQRRGARAIFPWTYLLRFRSIAFVVLPPSRAGEGFRRAVGGCA
ncbi:hypothetical protein B0H11DRAFT_35975 [Mycena galericulata]|nr:hypothetical protein B0H11DRAFT_35975 [Mycena galericulata]